MVYIAKNAAWQLQITLRVCDLIEFETDSSAALRCCCSHMSLRPNSLFFTLKQEFQEFPSSKIFLKSYLDYSIYVYGFLSLFLVCGFLSKSIQFW